MIVKFQSKFFWADEGDKQKHHMVCWTDICKPRDSGGLGIMSSKCMSIALLQNGCGALQITKVDYGWILSGRDILGANPLRFANAQKAPNSGTP